MLVTDSQIDIFHHSEALRNNHAGAYSCFEGWIRDHNDGHEVEKLEYEIFEPIAIKEGKKIINEAMELYEILGANCIHRKGLLQIGDCAVWVGVTAAHRNDAFIACRFIIDEVKIRLPIWKKEFYRNGDSGWVNCENCGRKN